MPKYTANVTEVAATLHCLGKNDPPLPPAPRPICMCSVQTLLFPEYSPSAAVGSDWSAEVPPGSKRHGDMWGAAEDPGVFGGMQVETEVPRAGCGGGAGRGYLLQVHVLPVHASEEAVFFHFLCPGGGVATHGVRSSGTTFTQT